MEWTSAEVIGVISYLLPGFLAAWIFYGLTAHPKSSPFERVVQALIFTAIAQALTTITRWTLERNSWQVYGPWTKEHTLVWSLISAALLGLLFAWFANKDWFHAALRWLRITKRTSYPSEWFSAFNRDKRYVILHLVGGRRLHGWPMEWPDQGDSGHFVMVQASWMLDTNECAPLHAVERLLIPANQVEMVELMKSAKEVTVSDAELKSVEKVLIELQETGETEDGKQSTATTAKAKPALQSKGSGRDGQATNAHQASAITPTPTKERQVRKRRRGR